MQGKLEAISQKKLNFMQKRGKTNIKAAANLNFTVVKTFH
jgi:hypothetical protein